MEVKEDPKIETESSEEKFSFLQETIKKEPVSKKKLFKKILLLVLGGILFGAAACLGFYALKPWATSWFQGRVHRISIPEDAENTEDGQENHEPVGDVAESAADYETTLRNLYQVAVEAERSVVTIRETETDLEFLTEDGQEESVSGVIIADNGREILVLGSNRLCRGQESWTVQFVDGKVYKASLKKQDKTKGLAVFAVDRSKMDSETWENMKIASLGNSNIQGRGSAVFALGNMFGYPGGVSCGMISSVKQEMHLADGSYEVLATDIPAEKGGTGILFNIDGEVIGLMVPEIWPDNGGNLVNACAISAMKPSIERLSNGESVPYVGIRGVMADGKDAEEQGIAKGLYVQKVEADSPAMMAGIQSGDVLTVVDGIKLTEFKVYQKLLQECEAGESIKIKGCRKGNDGYVDIEYNVTIGSNE